ncbi:MAG: DUF2306 domain-containing protein [Gemmatimonadaceae bacterium]|nr:DUF2306 domain-containing protein [Gemmatimonadaceae bacterium]
MHVVPEATRRPTPLRGFAGTALLTTLAAGQLLFLAYVLGSYGRSALRGDPAAWAHFSARGWAPGDVAGNSAMAAHVLLAAGVLLAGTLQLLPAVRRHVPALHRWSGRVYLTGCLVAATSGLWLVWVRGTVGDRAQHVAISGNALLLGLCAVMAWRTARARQFAVHRVWALRTYLVAGGVFYFRIVLALWLLVFRRPVGFDPTTFSGPFLTTLAFGVYVVGPLLLFEGFRRAAAQPGRVARAVMTVVTGVLTLVAGLGALAAVLVLWLPKLRG